MASGLKSRKESGIKKSRVSKSTPKYPMRGDHCQGMKAAGKPKTRNPIWATHWISKSENHGSKASRKLERRETSGHADPRPPWTSASETKWKIQETNSLEGSVWNVQDPMNEWCVAEMQAPWGSFCTTSFAATEVLFKAPGPQLHRCALFSLYSALNSALSFLRS